MCMPFKKGQSGNKKGRPKLNEVEKQNVAYFKQQLKNYSVVALEELYDLMCNSFNPEIRYKCATYILDRCYGRDFVAEQSTDENKDIKITLITKQGKKVDNELFEAIENELLEMEKDCLEDDDEEWGNDIYLGES